MKAIHAILIALLSSTSMAVGQTHNLTDAPDSIKVLSKALENKKLDDVLRAIVKQFGAPNRNTGSGVDILEWDVPEGLLAFNSHSGPVFIDTKRNKNYRLLKTTNPVAFNVLGSYEMTTPTPKHGPKNHYYMGNLHIDGHWRYRFHDSNQHQDKRAGQEKNFFLLHPSGKVSVEYIPPYESSTLLESVPEGAVIARLKFQSDNGKEVATFRLSSSELWRKLSFSGTSALSFRLDKPWNSYWD